jgi:F-type H+-transporting ATPase subunit delta
MTAIGRRYARAAVDAASEKGGASAVEQLADGLAGFRDAFKASEELRELLHNPVFEAQREQVLGKVLDTLGVGDEVRGVIRLLAERGRIGILDSVVTEVEGIADDRAGRVRAHVSTALALTDSQKARVGKALEKRLGQTVVVTVHVDPELLGGLVCRVGDLTLDSSVRRQLEILREQLEKSA